MSDLKVIARIPGVRGAVRGDLDGTFLEAEGEADGEAVAAEMGLAASSLGEAGEALGLGTLRRVAAAGPGRASVVVLRGADVISARVEPVRALPAVEKAIDNSLQEWT